VLLLALLVRMALLARKVKTGAKHASSCRDVVLLVKGWKCRSFLLGAGEVCVVLERRNAKPRSFSLSCIHQSPLEYCSQTEAFNMACAMWNAHIEPLDVSAKQEQKLKQYRRVRRAFSHFNAKYHTLSPVGRQSTLCSYLAMAFKYMSFVGFYTVCAGKA
jgi:hypothetical protein